MIHFVNNYQRLLGKSLVRGCEIITNHVDEAIPISSNWRLLELSPDVCLLHHQAGRSHGDLGHYLRPQRPDISGQGGGLSSAVYQD